MGARAELELWSKLPIRWDEIDVLLTGVEGSPTVLHSLVVDAVNSGRVGGRAPSFSTLWRRLQGQGNANGSANESRSGARSEGFEPNSAEARAVERIEAAVNRGMDLMKALLQAGEITNAEIAQYRKISKLASPTRLRRHLASGNLDYLAGLAANLESRAVLLERQLERTPPKPKTAPLLPAGDDARAQGTALVKPAGTGGVDPLYGTEGNTGWGKDADTAFQPPSATVIEHTTPTHTDVVARARWLMVAPLLADTGADPRTLAAFWRERFRAILPVSGAEYPGIPREIAVKYRDIHWRTLYRWREAIVAADEEAQTLQAPPTPGVVTLRHQYPDHRRGASKCTATVIARIHELHEKHPDWSASAIAYHLRQAGTDISDRRVQQAVRALTDAEKARARGGPAGEDVILVTRLMRETPYANRVWIIDNSFIKFDLVDPEWEGPLGEFDQEDFEFEMVTERKYPGGLIDRTRVRRLCMTTIIDLCTRKHLVVRVWDRAPNARTAVLALREAMIRYGVPEVVYSDNGSDFRSGDVAHLLYSAGVLQVFSVPYSPRSRGRIERPYRTIKERILPFLPGYVGGSNPRSWHDQELLSVAEVEQQIQTGIEVHLNERICRTTHRAPNEHYEASIGARGLAGHRQAEPRVADAAAPAGRPRTGRQLRFPACRPPVPLRRIHRGGQWRGGDRVPRPGPPEACLRRHVRAGRRAGVPRNRGNVRPGSSAALHR